jgi:hypothetical protein
MSDAPRSRPPVVLAPGASGGSPLRAPGQAEALPAVDDRAVEPETRQEMIDGQIVYVAPANEPHATVNSDLATLLTTHAATGYRAAVDLLTRTDKKNDFAPDASVFPDGKDPVTGGRLLERLAFEICDTQSRSRAMQKAAKLDARGVARIFCVDVNEYEVLEWSREAKQWRALSLDSAIEDASLVRPVAVAALLDAIERDNEVARALLTKQNPVLMQRLASERASGRVEGRLEGKREGRREGKREGQLAGKAEGLREGIRTACRLLGIALDDVREAVIENSDEKVLCEWLAEIERTRAWPEQASLPR